jgi:hypothetical protein
MNAPHPAAVDALSDDYAAVRAAEARFWTIDEAACVAEAEAARLRRLAEAARVEIQDARNALRRRGQP